MRKRLILTAAALLMAAACSDIDLAPFWSEYELPEGPALGLRDIAATPTGEVWVVGQVGEAWYCDGDSWININSGHDDYELTGVAPDEGGGCWAVGADSEEKGCILRYDPAEGWSEVGPPGTPAFLADVAARSDGSVVTVGSEGQVWRRRTDWELVWSDADYIWRAVDVHASGEALVVGVRISTGNGAYLHFNYTDDDYTVEDIDGGRLEDCALTDSDAGWAVDADGCIYRYDAGTMDTVADTGVLLRGLAVEPDRDDALWLCGPGGTLVHYVNGELEYPDSHTDENLHDLVLVNADEGWAAAQTLLLEYR
ncbi:MAG TPA: hypothetical protein VM054_09475 [bacterium]|nr:hypothetical protein [bacterium]